MEIDIEKRKKLHECMSKMQNIELFNHLGIYTEEELKAKYLEYQKEARKLHEELREQGYSLD